VTHDVAARVKEEALRLGFLACLFFQPSFFHDQRIRLAPLGQHLFELFG